MPATMNSAEFVLQPYALNVDCSHTYLVNESGMSLFNSKHGQSADFP